MWSRNIFLGPSPQEPPRSFVNRSESGARSAPGLPLLLSFQLLCDLHLMTFRFSFASLLFLSGLSILLELLLLVFNGCSVRSLHRRPDRTRHTSQVFDLCLLLQIHLSLSTIGLGLYFHPKMLHSSSALCQFLMHLLFSSSCILLDLVSISF